MDFYFRIKIDKQNDDLIVYFYRESHFFHEININMSCARYKAYSGLNCSVFPPEDYARGLTRASTFLRSKAQAKKNEYVYLQKTLI